MSVYVGLAGQENPTDMPSPVDVPPADRKLTVSLPAQVLRALKARTVREETTIRALLLEALARAGYPVPAGEIRDRRRPGTDSVHRSRRARRGGAS